MNQVKFSPLSNRETWVESFQAIDEDDAAIDLTGATIVYEVRHPQTKESMLSGSTDGGEITISTTTFTITFEVEDVRDLCALEYEVGCTIEIDDVTTQFFVGTLPVVDGVVS